MLVNSAGSMPDMPEYVISGEQTMGRGTGVTNPEPRLAVYG